MTNRPFFTPHLKTPSTPQTGFGRKFPEGGLDFLEVALVWKFPDGSLPKQTSKKFALEPPKLLRSPSRSGSMEKLVLALSELLGGFRRSSQPHAIFFPETLISATSTLLGLVDEMPPSGAGVREGSGGGCRKVKGYFL